MAELLLLNPRRRRRVAKTSTRKRRVSRRRSNPFKTVAVRRRRSNPIARVASRRRRRNPIARVMSRSRRRRNPIAMRATMGNLTRMFTDAAIGAGGAALVNIGWNQVNASLPTTLQTNAREVGAGDAVKAALTVALGILLSKPTKGLSVKAASGALTVQMFAAAQKLMPTMPMGFYSPAQITQGSARIGPNRAINGNGAGAQNAMGRYMAPGRTALLNGAGVNRYMAPGKTPLLSGTQRNERDGYYR